MGLTLLKSPTPSPSSCLLFWLVLVQSDQWHRISGVLLRLWISLCLVVYALMHQLRTCTPTSARCRAATWIYQAPHLPTATLTEKIMDRLPVQTTCHRNNIPSIHSCHWIGPFPCRCLCLTLCTASARSWIRPQHRSCA